MSPAPAREWWTAEALAEARLPDLPATKRGVAKVADRQGWANDPGRARRRKGQGGGWEYHWTLLPSRAQAHLLAQSRSVPAEAAPAPTRASRDAAWSWFEGLPEAVKAKARERLGAIQTVEALVAAGFTRHLAVIEVAGLTKAGARTIWTWLDLVAGVRADDRLAYLAPRHRAATRVSRRAVIDPRFGDLLKADALRLGEPSVTSCYDRCVRIAQAQGIPTVPLHTARRWLSRTITPAAWTLGRKGVEALKRMRHAQVRDKTAMHAMEGVNGDFHRFDVFVRFPAGPGGQKEQVLRPQFVGFQDIHSGRLLAWRVDRSANSQAVQLCIGDMIERWGIPEHVLLDNGREFAAKVITGGAPTRFRFRVREDDMSGLLTSLGCQLHWATPYSGQSKPIERAWRDLCDRVAKHPAFQGAYTGNKPDAKPEDYGTRAIPLDVFLGVLADEIELHNQRPDRRSEVAFGRSFAAVFDESYARSPIRKATAEQRRLWLMGAEGIRANRENGQLRFMGNTYWADWMHELRGRRVVVRFDRAALWDGLHVYGMDDAYLGFSPCTVKGGFFDVDDARSTQRAKRDWQAKAKAELAAARRLGPADLAAALAAIPMPAAQPVEATVIRPVFDASKAPRRGARTKAQEAAVEATQAEVVADLAARRAGKHLAAAPEDGRALYARACDLERREAAGERLTKEQGQWLAGFQGTPDYRTWAAMVADFGEDVLTG